MAWKSIDGGRGVAWAWFDDEEKGPVAKGPEGRRDHSGGGHEPKKQ